MNALSKKIEWTEVPALMSPRLKNDLIREHLPTVKWEALTIHYRLPRHVEFDDLMSSGIIGLIDAIDRFDCRRDVKFTTYAKIRIRGEILDSLRAIDPMSRYSRGKVKRLDKVTRELETKLGRSPMVEEIAKNMGVTIEQCHKIRAGKAIVLEVSLDSLTLSSNPSHEDDVERNSIAEAITKLPIHLGMVIKLRYYEGLSLGEIGALNGYSESRACQVLGHAIRELKNLLFQRNS